MKKVLIRSLVFLICIMLATGSLAGCGSSKQDQTEGTTASQASTSQAPTTEAAKEELPVIQMKAALGIGWNDGQDGPFDDDTAKEIMKISGVQLENIPLGEAAEARDNKLNIMLVSGDYPEILRINSDAIMQKYIKEGALLPLDELIAKDGYNIKRMYGDTILKKMADPNDGKLYYLKSWYGYTMDGGFFGVNIKRDLLKQIDPAVADSNNSISPEKFYELLKAFKEKFPQIADKASIPLSFSIDQRFFDGNLGILGILKAAYGIKENSEDADQNLTIDIKDPKFVEVLKYMNKLQREKLLDPEWPTLKYQVYATKLSQGNVFASTGAWFEPLTANGEFAKKDPMAQYFAYVIAADGVTNPPLCANSETGKEAITITKNCKNPDRAVKLLDFLASEDGNFLTFWGPKGVLWDVVDGKRKVKPEFIEEFQKDPQAFWKKHNVRKWNIVNGQELKLTEYTYSDGTTFEQIPSVSTPFQMVKDWQMASLITVVNTSYDSWAFDNIKPVAGTDEANIAQKWADLKEKELFKIIINSKNDEEVQNGLNALVAKADALGINKLESFMTEKYKANLQRIK